MYIHIKGTVDIKLQVEATDADQDATALIAESTEKWVDSMTFNDEGFISVALVDSATVVDADLPGYGSIVVDWNGEVQL